MHCEVCKFWDTSVSLASSSDTTGLCRRATPGFDDRTGKAVWPFTEEGDWCGEFQSNGDAAANG